MERERVNHLIAWEDICQKLGPLASSRSAMEAACVTRRPETTVMLKKHLGPRGYQAELAGCV
jgi:hypothetical protein